jgi:protein-tyrosine-phosphatase
VPNLDHYQVIVALDQTVKKAFPQKPRKVISLDWPVEDPSQTQGNPDQIQAAYEKTYQYLQSHIQDLVQAILGQKPSANNSSDQP